MPFRRITIALFLTALGLAGTLAFLAGCEKSPSAPVFDNPFDPQGPDSGNPLHLTATLGNSSILLSWTQPQGFNIAYYELSHSFNYFSDFLPIGSVEHSDAAFGSFSYENPEPTTTHSVKIQAFDADGNFTNLTDQSPVSRPTPPRVVVGDGSGSTATRNVTLQVTVSTGDTLRISNDRDFAVETRVPVAVAGQPQDIPWVLGEAAGNDTTLVVRVLAFPSSGVADTAVVRLTVDFAPAFTVAGNPPTVSSRELVLDIPLEGVISMRFAASEDGLPSQLWIPAAPSVPYTLANSANQQEIWGQFLGDFDFTATVSLTVVPDLLQETSFALDLPEDHITDESTVTVLAAAAATEMRFSESLDFSSVPWTAYADTSLLALSPAPGRKVIYGQFRNDWAESAILTDYVIYLSQPVDVVILAPAEGDTVPAATPLLVTGIATGSSGTAPVDSVKFDAGDGEGFRPVTGTDSWSFMWDVPAVTADTAVALRARAWAAGDSVTTSATVTVVPTGEQE